MTTRDLAIPAAILLGLITGALILREAIPRYAYAGGMMLVDTRSGGFVVCEPVSNTQITCPSR